MPLPEEYDSWRCDDCPEDAKQCSPDWQQCDMCGPNTNNPNCDDCCGSGGGHVCKHDPELNK